MLTYTVYSEAGGVAKTTTAANLAVAHSRAGYNVLMVDMDPQNASLSYLFDVDDDRRDSEADNMVRHLIDRPEGPFEDLIRTAEHGIDVIPTHNMYERLTQLLLRTKEIEETTAGEFNTYAQLYRVLGENAVNEDYDVLIVDPPAGGEDAQMNALYATRNVVIPLELSGKGQQSIEGLREVVEGLSSEVGVNVGVLALVPFKFEGTVDQQAHLDQLEDLPYDMPVVIGKRTALMEGCWQEQCSAFTYVDEHRDRTREHELDTLDQFETLADHLVAQSDLVAAETEVQA